MKKLIFLFLSVFLVSNQSYAGHMLGGEIGWECDSNGFYIFKMRIYRDCSGIGFSFVDETVQITGTPLPQNFFNNNISSILLKADQTKFMNARSGNNAPECNGITLGCNAQSIGVIQQFYYRSDPMAITNIPPSNGWTFTKALVCCRSNNINNIQSSGALTLVSKMYALPSQLSSYPCFDNSPIFSEMPHTINCNNLKGNIFLDPLDPDLDSISVSNVAPFNGGNAPLPATYVSGFTPTNPLPSMSFNPLNQDLLIYPTVGLATFLINDVSTETYSLNFKVNTYRKGRLIASNYREFPLSTVNCPDLSNNNPNDLPTIRAPFFKGGSTFTFEDSVVAGNPVNINMNVMDTNRNSSNTFQNIRLQIASTVLSKDWTNSSNCLGNIQNCATVNSTPIFDTLLQRYVINRAGIYNGQINWNTDCSHLKDSTYSKDYYFTLIATDDHCPVPATAAVTYKITVLPSAACSGTVGLYEENNTKFLIYPNPTTGEIQIKSTDAIQQLRLFSLDGKIVQQLEAINSERLRFTINQKPGVYFIELQSTSGNIERMKVIKK